MDLVFLRLLLAARCRVGFARASARPERGQATTEYVLVLLGVAAIAIAVATWATSTGKVGELLDTVFDRLADRIT